MSHGGVGRLVVLEGPEGAGKTTQLARLSDWLRDRGRRVTSLREPGGTPLGDELRRLVLEPGGDVAPAAEALLFMASRAQLVARVVRPALEAGTWVLLDRFFLSTYAYQVGGRGLEPSGVRAANALATGGLVPDLTVVLALDASEGLTRATRRGVADRMEGAAAEFHERVNATFIASASSAWQAAHPECGPIVTVDARGDEAAVAERVMRAVAGRWPETFPPSGGSER